MKRFLVKPMTSLAFLMLVSSCGGSSNTATTTTTTSSTSLAPTTAATTLPPTTTTTATITKPPVTTKAPTTTPPKIPTGTPEELAEKAAVSFGNAVDDALEYGTFAPVYQRIWNTYAAAGMTITIPPAYRVENPTGKPGFAEAYEVSKGGEKFCLARPSGANYVKFAGAC